jgi:hypothetical protein
MGLIDISIRFSTDNNNVTVDLFFSDSNVNQLLPLVEEYQIMAVKKKCEEFLLTKSGSMELLITGKHSEHYTAEIRIF